MSNGAIKSRNKGNGCPEISSSNPLISHLEKLRPGGTMDFNMATQDELAQSSQPGKDRGVQAGHASLQSASLAPGGGDGVGERDSHLGSCFFCGVPGSQTPHGAQLRLACPRGSSAVWPTPTSQPLRPASPPAFHPGPRPWLLWGQQPLGRDITGTGAKMPAVGPPHRSGFQGQDV